MEKVKRTLLALKASESGLARLASTPLPLKQAYQMQLMLEGIRSHLAMVDSLTRQLAEKYGTPGPNGQKVVTPESPRFQEANQELIDLMNTEVEILLAPLDFDAVGSEVRLKPTELEQLIIHGFIREPKGWRPAGTFVPEESKPEEPKAPEYNPAPVVPLGN